MGLDAGGLCAKSLAPGVLPGKDSQEKEASPQMADPVDTKLFDKRTAARYRDSGLLDEKAWEKHLKTLPDLTPESLIVDTRMSHEPDDDAD